MVAVLVVLLGFVVVGFVVQQVLVVGAVRQQDLGFVVQVIFPKDTIDFGCQMVVVE